MRVIEFSLSTSPPQATRPATRRRAWAPAATRPPLQSCTMRRGGEGMWSQSPQVILRLRESRRRAMLVQ